MEKQSEEAGKGEALPSQTQALGFENAIKEETLVDSGLTVTHVEKIVGDSMEEAAGKGSTTQTLGFGNAIKEETLVGSSSIVTDGNPNGAKDSVIVDEKQVSSGYVEVQMIDETMSENVGVKRVNVIRIPADLMIEIFSRLPAKSVGRFRCLSRQWCSVLRSPDFARSRSSVRPRLMFAVERKGSWSFFTSLQSSSSVVVTAEFHSRFAEDVSRFTCSHASGLFYFRDLWVPRAGGQLYVVCNPITGRFVMLPDVDMYRKSRGFLGFDPAENKFKVLAEAYPFCSSREHHQVLTLGTGKLSWKKMNVKCPQYDHSMNEGICIDGVLSYVVDNYSETPGNIVQFDVSSEEFRFVVAECFSDLMKTKLVNFKGKLGGVECIYGEADGRLNLELRLCVLENVERGEWSTNVYAIPENKLVDDPCNVSVAGVTSSGEIVLTMNYTSKPYYVFYYNPEKNVLKSVEVEGFGGVFEAVEYRGRVTAFVDYVERLEVDDFKQSRMENHCTKCKEHKHDDDESTPSDLSISDYQFKYPCPNCEDQEKETQ